MVDDVGDGFAVIVPGYGEGWVNREDVVSSVPFSDSLRKDQWRIQTHSIKKVSISLNKALVSDKERGIRELLKLIGAPITHLSLSIPADKEFDNAYLNCFWSYWPQLISLSTRNVTFDSFDSVLEAYASGRCRASFLSFRYCNVDNVSSVIALWRHSPIFLHRSLCQLEFGLGHSSDELARQAVVEAFLAMLSTNKHLEYLMLSLPWDLQGDFEDKFAEFAGERIRHKLPLVAKYAFLGVAKHGQRLEGEQYRSNRAIHAIGRLDHLPISTIFRFVSKTTLQSVALDIGFEYEE